MQRNWRKSRVFRGLTLLAIASQLALPPLAHASDNAQIVAAQIVPDGRTATTLQVQGTTTDIRTETIHGRAGFNSFSRFNVDAGNTVNLYLPDSTDALVNMVHDEASTIDGILNGYQDGVIGGDIYFLNPHGVMVGASGVLNMGSVYISTPTPEFMSRLLDGTGVVSPPHVARLLDNDMPLSRTGVIDIRGQINSVQGGGLSAGALNLAGQIEGSTQARINIASILNLDQDTRVVYPIDSPKFSVHASQSVTLTGRLGADGSDSEPAGDITIRGETITAGAGADISASGSGTNSAGTIRLEATADDTASITLNSAEIRGGDIILDADAVFSAQNAEAVIGAEITLGGNSTLTASGGITIRADAFNNGTGHNLNTTGAHAHIDIDSAALTATGAITTASRAEINSDLLNGDSIEAAVVVTDSDASVDLGGDATLESTAGNVAITAEAVSLSSLATGGSDDSGLALGVSAVDTKARLEIGDEASISGGAIDIISRTRSNVATIADAAAGGLGQIAIGVVLINDNTTTRITDASTITASDALTIDAKSEVTNLTASRTGGTSRTGSAGDNTTAVGARFAGAIDAAPALDTDSIGENLKDEFATVLGEVTDAFDASGGEAVQVAGAVAFSQITNTTQTEISAGDAVAPVIRGGDVAIEASGVTQTQSLASGRSAAESVSGAAGIAVQIVENTINADIRGSDGANVVIEADNFTVTASTGGHSGALGNQNRFGTYAASGSGDNADIGIAGAIAVGINEVNRTTATIGDNTSLDIAGELTLEASNDTAVTVTADGGGEAQQVTDAVFGVVGDGQNSPQSGSNTATIGVGASLAIATHNNDTRAVFGGGAGFIGSDRVDRLTITAEQVSTTQSQSTAAGSGSLALVPLAAITVARNTALAEIESGDTPIISTDAVVISANQTTNSQAHADGVSGADGTAAIGIAAGVVVGIDSNEAIVARDITSGAISITANSRRDISTGARALSGNADEGEGEGEESPEEGIEQIPDNASTNSTGDASQAAASIIAGLTHDADTARDYNFTSQLSINANAASNNANLAPSTSPDDDANRYDFARSNDASQHIGSTLTDADEAQIAIAAALGVNYNEGATHARIADGVSIDAGTGEVDITSLNSNRVATVADASSTDGTVNIGGGVGLNIASIQNRAEIGNNASITAGSITLEARGGDAANQINTDATAGVGTGEFALAGAVGLNVITQNDTIAQVHTGASLTTTGTVQIRANADTAYASHARAVVGSGNSIWDTVGDNFNALTDITIWHDGGRDGFDSALDQIGNNAGGSDGGGDAQDEDEGEGGVGIGAGIALNIIVAERTRAILDNDADILGGDAGGIAIDAAAETTTITDAVAGASPSDSTADDAKTSLDAAVAVAVVLKDVDAFVGDGAAITASDNVSIAATSATDTTTTTKGAVSASDTAVGASVAVGVVLEQVDARLGRDIATTGGLTVTARADSTDITLADAVAAGTVIDRYASKIGVAPESLTQSGSQLNGVDNAPTSLQALRGDFAGGTGASFDTTGAATNTGAGNPSGSEAQQSGSINIAAAVGVNWAEHVTRAIITDNVSITASDSVTVEAQNHANYRTRGSGLAVFGDTAIGVGVGILKTGQQTRARLGDGVEITNTGATGGVSVLAVSTENQGIDEGGNSFLSHPSAEAIAGAGGGDLGIAGALSLVVSTDSQSATVGEAVQISAPQNIIINSTATNKIVNRAWAASVSSDATCGDPGNCSSNDGTAVGASIAVSVVVDSNEAQVGEASVLTAGGEAEVQAQDLSAGAGEFILNPNDNATTTEDYITANYTAILQDSSYYAEAIAGAAAQNGNAGTGALAVTISTGSTRAIIGEGVAITAESIAINAHNESDARQLVGALSLSGSKRSIGASVSGIYLREDVVVLIGSDGASDNNRITRLTANTGDIAIDATAEQEALTLMAAGGLSGNDLALAGAFGFTVLDSDIEARIIEDATLTATLGHIGIDTAHTATIRNFALALSGSGGASSAGGSLAVNIFLADKKAIVGGNPNADNAISLNASGTVNIGVNARQEITNGIIAASASGGANALSGALSANIIKGVSASQVEEGADINSNPALNLANRGQSASVTVDDNTTILDLTGSLAAANSASVGVALAGNVLWKDVRAGVNSRVHADGIVLVSAKTRQNLTATTVGLAGSGGGFAGAGSVGIGLVKTTTVADVGSNALIITDGSVGVVANDDTDIFMLEPAAGFSAGGTSLAGAVGAAVFLGSTEAIISDNASITAYGNEAIEVAVDEVETSSPLLDGIFGGDDEATRQALASFNDGFSFDTIKDLFITERRLTESKRGVAVTAVADQDVISIAASGSVSATNAIAVSLSAGVGVHRTRASIGDGAQINTTPGTSHSAQSVLVRAISDTHWVDFSAALGVGAGTVGVGVGGDVVVQVKNTTAFIAENAIVRANDDVITEALVKDRLINSAATVGVGAAVGVAGTASVGVIINNTQARIDGDVEAEGDVTLRADAGTELIQIAGAIGGSGTVGVGASFGVAVAKGETRAIIGSAAQVDAKKTTSVVAQSRENSVAAVIAGGVAGVVGVAVSAGIKVHESTTEAKILGEINQRFTDALYTSQDVLVNASNAITTIDVIGGLGGGGVVGVGASLNALVIHNKAQASIEGVVSAVRDIEVEAVSSKVTKNFTLAGAAGGVVSVAGNVAVLLVGAQADEESNRQLTGEGEDTIAAEADNRNNALIFADILDDNASDGDYGRTGTGYSEVAGVLDSHTGDTNVGGKFTDADDTASLNQTKAFIAGSAVVTAGRDLTIEAVDTTQTVFAAGAVGGAGVVGVGATVGVVLVNSTAEAFIGAGARVDASRQTLIQARTGETVGSGAVSAGGAGIASVQGVILAQVLTSKTHAFIGDTAQINQNTTATETQDIAVSAISDTDLISVSGAGGGALVGVGITGDAVVLDKETKATIGRGASLASGGDISIDADATTDILQIGLSVNAGLVGITGAAGVIVAKNTTEASIGDNATLTAGDALRLQSRDDTEIDGVIVAGSGGAVAASGGVGVYILKSANRSRVGEGARLTALAGGDGIEAATGAIDNASTQIISRAIRDQNSNPETQDYTRTNAEFEHATVRGIAITAVTNEDIALIPVGAALGVVGIAGVVAHTTITSTTEALIADGVEVNSTLSGANDNQSLNILAVSKTALANISTGVSVGAGAIGLNVGSQIFNKTVNARLLGDAKARGRIALTARSIDAINQTMVSTALGGLGAGGIIGISAVNNAVLAEIGAESTVLAGDDIAVIADNALNLRQTAGNIAVGAVGGIGASLGVVNLTSNTHARIGANASVTAGDDLLISATAQTHLDQDIIGFAGGLGFGITGSVGVNILSGRVIAEIGTGAQINQNTSITAKPSQQVRILADDSITAQGDAGASAVGGIAGVGVGLVATVARNTTQSLIGDDAVIAAQDGVTVAANSTKDSTNQGAAFAGGVGLGVAGSVALTLIGGGFSDNASATLNNTRGSVASDVSSITSGDYENSNDRQNPKTNLATYTGDDDAEAQQLRSDATAGLEGDITGTASTSTVAEIGEGVVLTAGGVVAVEASESLTLQQTSGGLGIGAVGVGGFVAVADYNGTVRADIGNNTRIDGASGVTIAATVESGESAGIDSAVFGVGVAGVGIAASIAQVNLNENATARIGDNVTINSADDTAPVSIEASRGVDASVLIAALAAGVLGAGISAADITASGDAIASVGANTHLGSASDRLGRVDITAVNTGAYSTNATSASGAFFGATVGAFVTIADTGATQASIGAGSAIYAHDTITISSHEGARGVLNAEGVAVGFGVGVAGIFADGEINRDAGVTLGDNARLDGRGITFTAEAGDSAARTLRGNTTAASGGVLLGATGSGSEVETDSDTTITIGAAAVIKDSASTVIEAQNHTSTHAITSGVAGGVAAAGANTATSTNNADSTITIAQGVVIDSADNLTIEAESAKNTTAQTTAGLGGLLAITGGAATANNQATVQISLADDSSITAGNTAIIRSHNADQYDHRIDASSVGVTVQVAAGAGTSTGASTVALALGDGVQIAAPSVILNATNAMAKGGIDGANFAVRGGGTLSVGLGTSTGSLTHDTRITIGTGAEISAIGTAIGTGNNGNRGHAHITALSHLDIDDEAEVNVGGLVASPHAVARHTGVADTLIRFADGARLNTIRGDALIEAQTAPNIGVRALTSTYGAVAAGASAQATADITKTDRVIFAGTAMTEVDGTIGIYSGRLAQSNHRQHRIETESRIWNNTVIPIDIGRVSTINFANDAEVTIAPAAQIRSTGTIHLEATQLTAAPAERLGRDYQGVEAIGVARNLYQAGAETVLGGNYSDFYGSEDTSGSAGVIIDGLVETGIRKDVSVTIDSALNDYYVDNGTTRRYIIRFDNESTNPSNKWVLIDQRIIAENERLEALGDNASRTIPIVGFLDDTITAQGAEWTLAPEVDFGANIRREIAVLQRALNAYAGGSASRIDTVDNGTHTSDITVSATYTPAELSAVRRQIQDRIATLQAQIAIYGDGPVPAVRIADIEATTGDVTLAADFIAGRGRILAPSGETVEITNNSPLALIIGAITIPDIGGGHIIFNGAEVESIGDIARLNGTSDGTPLALTLMAGGASATPQITINNRFDSQNSNFNPDNIADIVPPSIALVSRGGGGQGGIRNLRGSVAINNATGSVFATASVVGGTVDIAAGGDFIFDAASDIFHSGGDPRLQTMVQNPIISASDADTITDYTNGVDTVAGMDNRAFGGDCTPARRELTGYQLTDGFTANDLAQAILNNQPFSHMYGPSFTDYASNCSGAFAGARQANPSFIAASSDIFLSANTLNINGLIQAGIANKAITVSQAEVDAAIAANPTAGIIHIKSADKTLGGVIGTTGDSRFVSGDISIAYDRANDALFVTGADISGGNLTVAGQIISTGGGKLAALDGYGRVNITNNSSKKLRLANFSTGGSAGVITIVDRLKDNGNGAALITEYRRNAGVITVHNNMGSASADQRVANPQAVYNPEDGARFNFMSGQQTVDRETEIRTRVSEYLWGVEAFNLSNNYWDNTAIDRIETDTLENDALPQADFVSVEPDNDVAYSFRADQIETTRARTTDQSGLDQCWWGGFLNMARYCQYSHRTEFVAGALRYNYHSLKADYAIPIAFVGDEGAGSITVASKGGVILSGQIRNGAGTTHISTAEGDIIHNGASDSLATRTATLIANQGSIGVRGNPIRINQQEGDRLMITAGGDVNLAAPAGSLYIDAISVSGTGAIRLNAKDNVNINSSGILKAHSISIIAETGRASALMGSRFRVDTDAENGGTLAISTATGSLDIEEVAGDLRLDQISAPDAITLTVADGTLLDGNSVERVDSTSIAELDALAEQMGLQGAAAEDKRTHAIATYEAQLESLYHDYFALRNVVVDDENSAIGWDLYDANFTYQASTQERRALGDDASRISQYEASQQARYQAGFDAFGDPAEYDTAFTYTASIEEISEITQGFAWGAAQLNNRIPLLSAVQNTNTQLIDTTLAIEAPNISGGDITVRVNNGSFGRLTHDFTVDLLSDTSVNGNADYNLGSLDNTARRALAVAGSEDIAYDNATGILTVSLYEDVDVASSGVVDITAQGVIYLGAEGDTRIEQAAAGGDVRIKMDGSLINGRGDDAAAVTGADILLESGRGSIGSSDRRFLIDAGTDGRLLARAREAIHLGEVMGDSTIASLYAPNVIDLSAAGRILDANGDRLVDIRSDSIILAAGGAIGEAGNALEITHINNNGASLNLASSGGGAWVDIGGATQLTGADLHGAFDLSVRGGLVVDGQVTTNGGAIGINTGGDFTLTADNSITTAGGSVSIDADSLADGLGLQSVIIEDTATIDLGAGSLTIAASDGVWLTGITSSSTADDAVTIRATTLQDGGDTNPDITTHGTGRIALGVHNYANLNSIIHTGESPLRLAVEGKNDNARAVAFMLGVESGAGIIFDRLSANSAGISAPQSQLLTITQGRLRDNLFLSLGGFNGRIGRQPNSIIDSDTWLLPQDPMGFFANGALTEGTRDNDYRCTGLPGFITNANAVLDFSFAFDNPSVQCSGVVTYYRVPFVLSVPIESNEQILNNHLATVAQTGLNNLRPIATAALIHGRGNLYTPNSAATDALFSIREGIEAGDAIRAANPEALFIGGFGVRAVNPYGAVNLGATRFIIPPQLLSPDDDDEESDAAVIVRDGAAVSLEG